MVTVIFERNFDEISNSKLSVLCDFAFNSEGNNFKKRIRVDDSYSLVSF